MITITSRSFWDAERRYDSRNFKHQEKHVRRCIEKQLRKMLREVKHGSRQRKDVVATATVKGMFFPNSYENDLNKRGFVVVANGDYNSTHDYRRFNVILKDFNPFHGQ